MKNIPSSCSKRRASAAASASISPCSTTCAPQEAVRVTFVAGVCFGMTMVALMPASAACRATAWAWLPADIATTPRAFSSGVSRAMRLAAPRSLKAPVAWRCSYFMYTSAPVRREMPSARKKGERSTAPFMRAAAACTSSKLIICSAVGDFEDFVGFVAAGGGYRHRVADALGNERLGERRGNGETRALDVSLMHADDLVADLDFRILVDEMNGRAEFHRVAGKHRRINHFRGRGDFLQLGDAAFDEGLALARGMVLGIFREVAMGAGFGDSPDDGRAFICLQIPQFILECHETRGGHGE